MVPREVPSQTNFSLLPGGNFSPKGSGAFTHFFPGHFSRGLSTSQSQALTGFYHSPGFVTGALWPNQVILGAALTSTEESAVRTFPLTRGTKPHSGLRGVSTRVFRIGALRRPVHTKGGQPPIFPTGRFRLQSSAPFLL